MNSGAPEGFSVKYTIYDKIGYIDSQLQCICLIRWNIIYRKYSFITQFENDHKYSFNINIDVRCLFYTNKLFFYPALILFEQSNCIDSIFIVIYDHWLRYRKDEFADTKGLITFRKLKKDRKQWPKENGQKKTKRKQSTKHYTEY